MQAVGAEAPPLNIGKMLDEGRWAGYGKWVLVFAALAFTVDGMAGQVLGLCIPAFIKDWNVPRAAFASVTAIGLLGVALGTTVGGVLGDRFGRCWVLNSSILLFGIVTASTAWAHSIPELCVLRALAGLGLGAAIPNATALIAEFTPISRRSLAIAIGMTFIPIGGLICSSLAAVTLLKWGWRGMFQMTGIASVVAGGLLIMVMPESPRFLLRTAARGTELRRLLARLGYVLAESQPIIYDSKTVSRTPLNALFGHEIRRDTLALWSAFFFTLLAAYSFFSWGPVMLASRGYDFTAASAGLTAFNLGGIVGGIAVGWAIGRFGSSPTMMATAAVGLSVSGILAYEPFSAANGMSGIILGMTLEGAVVAGLQMGAYTIAAHVYPAYVRATGVGSASASGRIGAVVSSFTAVLTLNAAGARGYFAFIAAAMAAAIISLLFVRGHTRAAAHETSAAQPTGR